MLEIQDCLSAKEERMKDEKTDPGIRYQGIHSSTYTGSDKRQITDERIATDNNVKRRTLQNCVYLAARIKTNCELTVLYVLFV